MNRTILFALLFVALLSCAAAAIPGLSGGNLSDVPGGGIAEHAINGISGGGDPTGGAAGGAEKTAGGAAAGAEKTAGGAAGGATGGLPI